MIEEMVILEPQLKLYVWEDVLCDYSCGVMFALAYDEDEARRLILGVWCESDDEVEEGMQRIYDAMQSPSSKKVMRRLHYDEKDLVEPPKCVTSPEGFACGGGT